MRLVRQRDDWGCGIAVLAMITGRTYVQVRELLDSQDGHGHDGDWSRSGITYISIDRILFAEGFAVQRTYAGWAEMDGTPWPPEPWAPVHLSQVVQPSGNGHWVVMDEDGKVLDPLRPGRHSLTDWEKINNVAGLWKVT